MISSKPMMQIQMQEEEEEGRRACASLLLPHANQRLHHLHPPHHLKHYSVPLDVLLARCVQYCLSVTAHLARRRELWTWCHG